MSLPDRFARVPPEALPGLTDTHCHLNLPAFDSDRAQVLERARRAGLERILIPGIDLPGSEHAARIAHSDPILRFAPGIHPHESASFDDKALAALRRLARDEGACAIGETGLDYFRGLAPRDRQREAFRAQLALAQELGLPVIVHIRDARDDALAILSEFAGRVRGVLHAFSGDPLLAEKAGAMGFCFGVGGPLTYKKAETLRSAFRVLPPDRILLETDAPYLPPEGNRGARNEPALVLAVAQRAAPERGIEPQELAALTRRNAGTLFAWE
ncbi:MAG: TatD family hydrolase [Anaerolineales bacterium]|nr:TatD family hydrolase [Anaerolineales bacterium]